MNEDRIAAVLRAAGQGQPPQPADRLAAVTARAHRMARQRVTTGLVIMLVIVGVVAATPWRRGGPPDGSTVTATTPIGEWPDRSLSADRGVAAGAVREWSRRTGGSAGDVRWLFRGTVGGRFGQYLAVFLAPAGSTDPTLVVARADREQVNDVGDAIPDGGGPSPWAINEVAHVGASPPDHIGVYLDGGGEPPRNVVFVLADPTTRHLYYTLSPLAGADAALPPGTITTGTGQVGSTNGMFVEDVGPLDGRLTVELTDAAGRPTPASPLAPDWSQPTLATPAEPQLPASFHDDDGITGQTQRQDNGQYAGAIHDQTAYPAARWVVYLRCYGGGRLDLSFMDIHGSVDCDGRDRHLTAAKPHTAITGFDLHLTSTTLQAYHLMIGTIG